MARWAMFLWASVLCAAAAQAQEKPAPKPAAPAAAQEQEPPEEDENLTTKEYTFNPLQATKELQIGNYYFKKGSYRAAAQRYREATRWNDGYADAWLKLGDASERLKDGKAAREAYRKYLQLEPDGKNAGAIRRKLGPEKDKQKDK